jgi:hypothetical protein
MPERGSITSPVMGWRFARQRLQIEQPLGEAHVSNDGDAIAIELAPELRRLAFEPGASRRLILPSRRRRGRAGALTAQQRGW